MSIDLFVYTESTKVVRAKELTTGTADADWEFAVVTGEQSLLPAASTAQCLVVGWRSSDSSGVRARGAVNARDARQLDTLYRENAVGFADVRAEQFAADAEELAEFRDAGIAQEHIGRIQAAKMRYVISTNASRNPLSSELQHDLWLLFGVLTNGLCEDPQKGEFIDAAQGPGK